MSIQNISEHKCTKIVQETFFKKWELNCYLLSLIYEGLLKWVLHENDVSTLSMKLSTDTEIS